MATYTGIALFIPAKDVHLSILKTALAKRRKDRQQ